MLFGIFVRICFLILYLPHFPVINPSGHGYYYWIWWQSLFSNIFFWIFWVYFWDWFVVTSYFSTKSGKDFTEFYKLQIYPWVSLNKLSERYVGHPSVWPRAYFKRGVKILPFWCWERFQCPDFGNSKPTFEKLKISFEDLKNIGVFISQI